MPHCEGRRHLKKGRAEARQKGDASKENGHPGFRFLSGASNGTGQLLVAEKRLPVPGRRKEAMPRLKEGADRYRRAWVLWNQGCGQLVKRVRYRCLRCLRQPGLSDKMGAGFRRRKGQRMLQRAVTGDWEKGGILGNRIRETGDSF